MLPGAGTLLAATRQRLEDERTRFDAQPDTPPELVAACATRTAARHQLQRLAERHNIELLEQHLQPIDAYLGTEREILGGLSGHLAAQSAGHTVTWCVPYFYQDWGGTESFQAMLRRIRSAVDAHARHRGRALVLGSGASGLLYGISDLFETCLGTDLSAAQLLLARHIVHSGSLTLGLHPEAHLLSSEPLVTVHGPRAAPDNLHWLISDMSKLPLGDASVSCVLTQYCMGIVPDPARVIQEINRVLMPGGLWIVYEPPFKLRCDPAGLRGRAAGDMPALAAAFGFTVLESRMLRPEHMALASTSALRDAEPTPARSDMSLLHPIIFCVAQRQRALPPDPIDRAFADYFLGSPRALHQLTARLTEPLQQLTGTVSYRGQTRIESQMRLGSQSFQSLLPPVTTPPLFDALLHGCLQRLRGDATLETVVSELHRATQGLLSERDLVLSLYLLRQRALIELGTRAA